jgi:hypothetical protein
VGAFTNAVNTLITSVPPVKNPPPTDPPATLSPPDYGTCAPTSGPPPIPSDNATILGLTIAIDVAHDAAIVADKVCDTIVEVLGEGTNLPACIVAVVIDLIEAALEQVKEGLTFCDANVVAAQTQSAWLNSIVIDTDLANLGTNMNNQFTTLTNYLTSINTALTTHDTAVGTNVGAQINALNLDIDNRSANTDVDIKNSVTASTTSLTTLINTTNGAFGTRANQIDSEISTFQSGDLRLFIEHSLSSGNPVGIFELPSTQGGYLELVRTIVGDVVTRLLSAGTTLTTATKYLGTGDTAYKSGQWKTAYQSYQSAYTTAVK